MPKPPAKVRQAATPAPGTAPTGPWWLDAELSCPHCLQGYVHGLHYRCSGCDGEVCAHCVIELRATLEILCPGCDDQPEESS